MSNILRQNEPDVLTQQAAATAGYRKASRLRGFRIGVSLLFAGAVPVVLVVDEHLDPYLAASAGAWALTARALFIPITQHIRLGAIRIQELYETVLFSLPWNQELADDKPEPSFDPYGLYRRYWRRDWFPDVSAAQPRIRVLLCQRYSAQWARRDHNVYGVIVMVVACLAAVGEIVGGLVLNATLTQFLIRAFFPSLPAFIEAVDISSAHRVQARRRGRIDQRIDETLEKAKRSKRPPSNTELRRIQDAIFLSRRDGPSVPNVIYRFRRVRRRSKIDSAMREEIAHLPDELRT